MDDKYVSVLEGYIEDNHLYMVDIDTWFFVDYNLDFDQLSVIADIGTEMKGKLCWVKKILHVENEFFFIIRNSKKIISYNPEKGINIYGEEYPIGIDEEVRYADACVLNDRIYMLPIKSDGCISIFNLKTRKYEDDIDISQILNCRMTESRGISRYIHNDKDDVVWFCLVGTDNVFKLDLRSLKAEHVMLDSYGAYEYVLGDEQNILGKTKDEYVIEYYYEKLFLALPPQMDKLNMIYPEGNNKVEVMLPSSSKLIYKLRFYDAKFSKGIIKAGRLFLLPFSSNGIVEVNLETMKSVFHPSSISSLDLWSKRVRNDNGIITENEDAGLGAYLYAIGEPYQS